MVATIQREDVKMKRSRINPISKKKAVEIRAEKPIRKLLFARANGCCENCGQTEDYFGLHPHEIIFRSAGGKLSLENSIILCNGCHDQAQLGKIKADYLFSIVAKRNSIFSRL